MPDKIPQIKRIKIEKRYPSQFFIDNRDRAEEWLEQNAPDFVLEIVKEMTEFIEEKRIRHKRLGNKIDEKNSVDKRTS